MGSVCDWIGPRLGMSVVLLLSAPCVFGMALANKAIDFIMLRFGIGFGLSAFVACQFWTTCMFNVKIVGAHFPRGLVHPCSCHQAAIAMPQPGIYARNAANGYHAMPCYSSHLLGRDGTQNERCLIVSQHTSEILKKQQLKLKRTKTTQKKERAAGIANATSGGWGNLGGGVTQLLMPLIFTGIKRSVPDFIAWRWAMFVPAFMHIIAGIMILFFSVDLPDGNYAVLKAQDSTRIIKDNPWKTFMAGALNYRCVPPTPSAQLPITAKRFRSLLQQCSDVMRLLYRYNYLSLFGACESACESACAQL